MEITIFKFNLNIDIIGIFTFDFINKINSFIFNLNLNLFHF